VGNYFRPRATLGLYLCLAGQIQVKYAFSKLKMAPSRAGCGPRAVCCPLQVYWLLREHKDNNLKIVICAAPNLNEHEKLIDKIHLKPIGEDLISFFTSANGESKTFLKIILALIKVFPSHAILYFLLRGDETDYGYIPQLETGSGSSFTAVDAIGFKRGDVLTPVEKDPTWEDMLIAYATVPGYVANR
jgi:hypothetical protein